MNPIDPSEVQYGKLFYGPGSKVLRPSFRLKMLTMEQFKKVEAAKKFIIEQGIKCVLQTDIVHSQQLQMQNAFTVMQKQQAWALMCRIYIGSVNITVNEDILRATFTPFGAIKMLSVNIDPSTGKHKGFAFLEYEAPEGAMLACDQLNGLLLGGKNLKVGRPTNMPQAQAMVDQHFKESKDNARIYVASIHPALQDNDLIRGYAYLEFDRKQSATDAIAALNLFELGGQRLRVGKAITQPNPDIDEAPLATKLKIKESLNLYKREEAAKKENPAKKKHSAKAKSEAGVVKEGGGGGGGDSSSVVGDSSSVVGDGSSVVGDGSSVVGDGNDAVEVEAQNGDDDDGGVNTNKSINDDDDKEGDNNKRNNNNEDDNINNNKKSIKDESITMEGEEKRRINGDQLDGDLPDNDDSSHSSSCDNNNNNNNKGNKSISGNENEVDGGTKEEEEEEDGGERNMRVERIETQQEDNAHTVLQLENVVGANEVDGELEEEVREECSNYGDIQALKIVIKAKDGGPDDDATAGEVLIFIKYSQSEGALKAREALTERFFAGRKIRASTLAKMPLDDDASSHDNDVHIGAHDDDTSF